MNSAGRQILEKLSRNRAAIRNFGVRELSLFGSFANTGGRADSDVDVLVRLNRKTFDAYMGLKELLERIVRRRVDLVLADALKPRLRSRILREAIRVPGL